MPAPAHVMLSAAALAAATLASPAAAHGMACDVIPWSPTHQPNNAVRGLGEAQCFPETHSFFDVRTCLQYRQLPIGAYETVVCEHRTSTVTGNGLGAPATTVDLDPRCRDGWWRTRVTGTIGSHPAETNESPDVLVICDADG